MNHTDLGLLLFAVVGGVIHIQVTMALLKRDVGRIIRYLKRNDPDFDC